jgi:hypothetical protein
MTTLAAATAGKPATTGTMATEKSKATRPKTAKAKTKITVARGLTHVTYRYAAKQQQGSHELQRHGSSKDGSTNRDAAKAGKPTTTGSPTTARTQQNRENSKSKDASSRVGNFGKKK